MLDQFLCDRPMTYVPLHHKYRPQTFAQLVGQEAIATTLANALTQDRIAPAYLFTGARGTGKTSSARIFAKSLNCIGGDRPTPEPCGVCEVCQEITRGGAIDVIEIDAASNTGVDSIRELIERAQFAPVRCRYKVYIIDECHMLTSAAFNALLKTLEEPPDRVIFVLATTDPQRVLPTIISRCQRFDFRRIPLDSLVQHLTHISGQEKISIAPDALNLIGQISQGGLRDAESLLDQLSLSAETVTAEKVWDLVGAVPERDLMALTNAIASDDAEATIDLTRKLMDRGREPLIVLQNLASFYRDLLIAKTSPNRNDLAAITPPTWATMTNFVKAVELPWLLQGQQHLRSAEVQIKNTTQPRLWLEITLMGLLPSAIGSRSAQSIATTIKAPTIQAPQSHPPASPPLPDPVRARLAVPQPHDNPPTPIAPPSQPIAPPPISIAEPPIAENPDLATLWQTILSNIDEAPSRAILSTNCQLIAINGNEVKIGVPQKNMLEMVKKRSKQLGQACAKSLKSNSIKLSITILPGKPPEAPPIARSAEPPLSPSSRKGTPPAPPRSPSQPIAPAISLPADRPPSSPSDRPTDRPIPNIDTYTPPGKETWEIDELTRATRSLADAFNGKIINLDDDTPTDDPETSDIPNIADIMGSDGLDAPDDDTESTPF
jgi:DNA polymerase III subunit gamma/tau